VDRAETSEAERSGAGRALGRRVRQRFSLTGSYWLHRFGEAWSYHNIALALIEAHLLFHWSDPQWPEGWHGVVASEDGPNTVVYVHK